MFSTIILFQFIFSSIINCHQNDNNELEDNKLEECKKLFASSDDERIKKVLSPLAKSIEKFGFTKPADYFKIFPKYKDAIENHKSALSQSKKSWKIFPSNNIVPDFAFQDIQKENNERGQTINTFKENIDINKKKKDFLLKNCTFYNLLKKVDILNEFEIRKYFYLGVDMENLRFMKALKKPLEYNCLLNPIMKGKTIRHGLDIIMNGKINCNDDETKKNHSDLCNKINSFLEEIGFFKVMAIKPNLETITSFKHKAKKVSKKPNLDMIPEGQDMMND